MRKRANIKFVTFHFTNKMKKAELTTQQIVLLIILLVSFIVILFLLFRLNLGKESDSEICHNSVVIKGTAAIPADATPLKCSRTYVCITKDNTCEGMTKPEIKKVKTEEEIYEVLASEMSDCWWMFGEGKVDYVGKDLTPHFYCSICSQILFDDSLDGIEGIEGKISQEEFYSFLENKPTKEGETTYLYYLTGFSDMNSFQGYLNEEDAVLSEFELNKQYFILTGINSVVGTWKWAGIGLIAGGLIAAPFTGGASFGISALIMGGVGTAGGVGGYFVGTAVKGEGIDNDFLKPVIVEANSETLDKFNCRDILNTA